MYFSLFSHSKKRKKKKKKKLMMRNFRWINLSLLLCKGNCHIYSHTYIHTVGEHDVIVNVIIIIFFIMIPS